MKDNHLPDDIVQDVDSSDIEYDINDFPNNYDVWCQLLT